MLKISSPTFGLGDTLLLTAVTRNLPNQLIVQLPFQHKRFADLFYGQAQVEFCAEHELSPTPDYGGGHYALRKLRGFFGAAADKMEHRPLVLYSDVESECWAHDYLLDKPNPVIVCPFVAPQWAAVRDMPESLAQCVVHNLKDDGFTPIVLQSGQKDWNCPTLDNLELRRLICLMRKVGRYEGANTGLYHLAVALGCLITCHQPPDSHLFLSEEWCYFNHPTIKHVTW